MVANRLQDAGLLIELQFGLVKRKSAMDAVLRVVTREQRTLARGGGAGAVMEDVKRTFNIVRIKKLIQQMDCYSRGKEMDKLGEKLYGEEKLHGRMGWKDQGKRGSRGRSTPRLATVPNFIPNIPHIHNLQNGGVLKKSDSSTPNRGK